MQVSSMSLIVFINIRLFWRSQKNFLFTGRPVPAVSWWADGTRLANTSSTVVHPSNSNEHITISDNAKSLFSTFHSKSSNFEVERTMETTDYNAIDTYHTRLSEQDQQQNSRSRLRMKHDQLSEAPSYSGEVSSGQPYVVSELTVPVLTRDYAGLNITCSASTSNITQPLTRTVQLNVFRGFSECRYVSVLACRCIDSDGLLVWNFVLRHRR